MAELEVDQSNLPRVEEVCQSFAVLEDGALAHNLQEQEIEQYYTANVQKNQLVQRDIRIARQLQNEEQDRQQHLSRQREEQDSEYARVVQEELQRCAEEARRREEEDQEIAKRIQEEEELRARRRLGCQSSASRDGSTAPGLLYPTHLDHARARVQGGPPHHWHPPRDRRPPTLSPSPSPSPPPSHSEYWPERNPDDSEYWPERNPDDNRYPDERLTDDPFTEAQHSEDHHQEDQYPEVQQQMRRGRPAPVVGPAETAALGAPFSGSWADALRLITQDMSEHGLVESASGDNLPSTPLRRLERVVLSHEQREAAVERRSSHRSSYREDRRVWGGREDEDRCSGYGEERVGWRSEPRALRHSASVRCSSSSDAGRPVRPLERVGSWASSHSSDKRVHFQDDRRRNNGFHRDGRQAHEGSYEGFRERGEVVRYNGDPRPVSSRGRGHQTYPSKDDWHHQQQQQVPPLQRNAFTRRSYHGDARQSRQRRSFRDGRSNGYRQNFDLGSDSHSIPEECGGEWAEGPSLRERAARERRSCRSYREHRGRLDSPGHQVASPLPRQGERESGARRWRSERRAVAEGWHQELGGEDGFSSGEEGLWERRVDSHTARSHRPSDTGVPSRSKSAPLAMGDLQQVLLDEELARRLQDEEERLLQRSPRQSPPSRRPHIHGDFRVAQVAQDEEIARFMQKQEIKAKHGWGEADALGSSPDSHNPYDRRVAMQRQRERLDSQGLPSPPEDYQPDEQPPSPVGMAAEQPVRNIAEELDPTFQSKRMETLQVGQPGLSKRMPGAQLGCCDSTEEPAFVQPTKRPNEKLGQAKAKEKKENSKQKENCKQQ